MQCMGTFLPRTRRCGHAVRWTRRDKVLLGSAGADEDGAGNRQAESARARRGSARDRRRSARGTTATTAVGVGSVRPGDASLARVRRTGHAGPGRAPPPELPRSRDGPKPPCRGLSWTSRARRGIDGTQRPRAGQPRPPSLHAYGTPGPLSRPERPIPRAHQREQRSGVRTRPTQHGLQQTTTPAPRRAHRSGGSGHGPAVPAVSAWPDPRRPAPTCGFAAQGRLPQSVEPPLDALTGPAVPCFHIQKPFFRMVEFWR